MDRLTVPLEVGKKYICRDGQVVTVKNMRYALGGRRPPIAVTDGPRGEFEVYAGDGRVSDLPRADIIADYIEPAKGHPHAALMTLYAQDAAETDKPWERWEYRNEDSNVWLGPMAVGPSWYLDCQYRRRKPKTIRIGEYDVPEPMRVAPEPDTAYYVPSFMSKHWVTDYLWEGDSADMLFLASGLAHTTRDAAEAHARAVISLSSP